MNFSSSSYCIWFSPNHQSKLGDWHTDSNGGASSIPGFPADSGTGSNVQFSFTVTVNGIPRTLQWQGNPNNSSFANVNLYTTQGWNGGGVRMKLLDPTCEFQVLAVTCNKCDATNTSKTDSPASFGSGSSLSPINGSAPGGLGTNKWQGDATRSVYYHTFARDHDNGKDRCKFGMVFRINCV